MNIAIVGYGKMGKMIQEIAINRGHKDVRVFDPSIETPLKLKDLDNIDVAIEFSTPDSAPQNYLICFQAGVPVVSGTTGWLSRWDEICKAALSSNTGFFYSSNFSLGVNLFFKLNAMLARIMAPQKDYIPHIEEIHHIHKTDAPSGTAITLAEVLFQENNSLNQWVLNSIGTEHDLPIFSTREGNVTGTHTVSYVGDVDKISIKHEAFKREGFAFGAVLAAEFLNGKKGIYSMNDLLAD